MLVYAYLNAKFCFSPDYISGAIFPGKESTSKLDIINWHCIEIRVLLCS